MGDRLIVAGSQFGRVPLFFFTDLMFPTHSALLRVVTLALILGFIAAALWGLSRTYLICPDCDFRINNFPNLSETGRCSRCKVVVLIPEPPPDPASVKRNTRNFCIRLAAKASRQVRSEILCGVFI
jgi:hypothetical protein